MINMGKRKYNTEEERRTAKLESYKRCYQRHKEERQKKALERYEKNKKERNKKHSEWQKNNKEYVAEYNAEYYKNNEDYFREYHLEYCSTPKGRAVFLLQGYRRADKESNRDDCTLTAEWIVNNVFSGQCCHYCGESDWRKLGVDRKDSSLPHTPENCVPCCAHCNKKKGKKVYDEFIRQIGRIA